MEIKETTPEIRPIDKNGDYIISWDELVMDKYGVDGSTLEDYQKLDAVAPEMRHEILKVTVR